MTANAVLKDKLELLTLPNELLLAVFKAQHSVADAVRLSSTCRSLKGVWQWNSRTIADTILPREITCYLDALSLAEAQSRLESTDKQSPPSSVLSLLPRLHANTHEADWVCSHAASHFALDRAAHIKSRTGKSCDIHGPHLQAHERQRVIHCWYFFKLYALSYFSPTLRQECDSVLARMSVVEVVVMWYVVYWLCEVLEPELQEELEIWDDDPPEYMVGLQAHDILPQYDEARKNITNDYIEKRKPEYEPGHDAHEKRQYGPCDICESEPCVPRPVSKGLWE